jgi:hypothetical protein
MPCPQMSHQDAFCISFKICQYTFRAERSAERTGQFKSPLVAPVGRGWHCHPDRVAPRRGTARRFTGTKRVIPVARDASVSVEIGGDQWRYGRVGRYITAIVGYEIPGR